MEDHNGKRNKTKDPKVIYRTLLPVQTGDENGIVKHEEVEETRRAKEEQTRNKAKEPKATYRTLLPVQIGDKKRRRYHMKMKKQEEREKRGSATTRVS